MKINSFLRENNLEITSFWLAEHNQQDDCHPIKRKGKAPFSIPSDNKSKDRKANFPLLSQMNNIITLHDSRLFIPFVLYFLVYFFIAFTL